MDAYSLQVKQELLKNKRRQLRKIYGSVGVAFAVFAISSFWLKPNDSILLAIFSFFLSILFEQWSTRHIKSAAPITEDIQSLKQQIKEEESALWVEEVTARIKSGEIKPNPKFKDIS